MTSAFVTSTVLVPYVSVRFALGCFSPVYRKQSRENERNLQIPNGFVEAGSSASHAFAWGSDGCLDITTAADMGGFGKKRQAGATTHDAKG